MARKILIVDDETDIRAGFAEYIQVEGYLGNGGRKNSVLLWHG